MKISLATKESVNAQLLLFQKKTGEIVFSWCSDDPKQLPDFDAIKSSI